MDSRILTALSAAPEGLTVRQLTAQLKTHYPEEKDLKSSVNSLLYTVLEKSKRVAKHEPAAGTQAPIWKLAESPSVTFVDLATATPSELESARNQADVRYYGPLNHPNAPANAILADGHAFKLVIAAAEERCAGRKVIIVSTAPELRS